MRPSPTRPLHRQFRDVVLNAWCPASTQWARQISCLEFRLQFRMAHDPNFDWNKFDWKHAETRPIRSWVAFSCVVLSPCPCFPQTFVLDRPFNSTNRCYFEYDNVNGPANIRVEWIRVYVPCSWQPVVDSTVGPAPDGTSTYRKWCRFYHFEVFGLVTAAQLWILLYMAIS